MAETIRKSRPVIVLQDISFGDVITASLVSIYCINMNILAGITVELKNNKKKINRGSPMHLLFYACMAST